jgi:hypothetical protein
MFHVHSDEFTSTSKSDQCFVLFSMQMALYESILASPHRTLNGEEADYFYVPVLDSCLITRSDDAPHLLMPVRIVMKMLYFSGHGVLYC